MNAATLKAFAAWCLWAVLCLLSPGAAVTWWMCNDEEMEEYGDEA